MAKKPKKEGLLRKITRRFSRKKLEEVSSDTTRLLVEVAKAAVYGDSSEETALPRSRKKVSNDVSVTYYRAYGKDFYHVAFRRATRLASAGTILRKDPISRKFTRVPKGKRQSGYYRDGYLND